jgi:HPt (histidine-containing phosphotransfer) domain-containing protein
MSKDELLNLQKLEQVFGASALNDLIKSFTAEATELVASARQAAAGKDLDQLLRATHQLRGLGLCFEVEKMALLVGKVEAATRDARWDEIDPELLQIAKIIETVETSFNGAL